MNRPAPAPVPVIVPRTGRDVVVCFDTGGGGFAEDGIEHFTGSVTHHVAMWYELEDPRNAICWEATPPAVHTVSINLADPKWVCLQLPPLSLEQRMDFLSFWEGIRGAGYDYQAFAGFLSGFLIGDDPRKWFCDESSLASIDAMNVGLDGLKVGRESPASEFWRLTGTWPDTLVNMLNAQAQHNAAVRLPGWKPKYPDPTDHYPGSRRPPK